MSDSQNSAAPTGAFDRRALAILLLTAALVTLLGLWAFDRAALRGSGEGAGAAGGAGGEVTRWKLVTTWPKNLPGLGHTPEVFADMVREMSAGRLQIRVYGAGEIVPAFEVFDAVSGGVAEIGHGASYYWKGKIPASVFFTAVCACAYPASPARSSAPSVAKRCAYPAEKCIRRCRPG